MRMQFRCQPVAVAARINVSITLLWPDDVSPGQSDDVAPLRAAPIQGRQPAAR